MNNKGELTTTQIISLIILIAGFSIVLIFLFRLNLGDISDKEICHNSVVLQSKSLVGSNLNCKTNYACISDGGECSNFVAQSEIKVNSSNEEEIFQVIADEMADCWWMFGQGEVNYPLNNRGYSCAICNVVKFDSKVQENFEYLDYANFFEYIANKPKEGTETYLKYLYGFYTIEEAQSLIKKESKPLLNSVFSTENKYAIIMGFNPELGKEEEGDYIHPLIVPFDQLNSHTNCARFDLTSA